MAKFKNSLQQYVIRYGDKFFSVNKGNIEWIDNADNANKYASAYAAKSHLRSLTPDPKDVWYEVYQGG